MKVSISALHSGGRRGGALLAVLWLSAALAAIAFSAAQTVRAERDRTANLVDGTRAALLAWSGVERGLLYLQWGPGIPLPDGRPRFWAPGLPFLRFSFPSGEALVEIIPESSKMNVNAAPPDFLARLIMALGYPPPLAAKVAAANCRQGNGGHHRHTANPDDHGKDMQGARDYNIIHDNSQSRPHRFPPKPLSAAAA